MFEMGSTVAIIFECPKNYQISRKEGEKVFLGESLLIPS
jgi:Phosphatidylserine decarboxylase